MASETLWVKRHDDPTVECLFLYHGEPVPIDVSEDWTTTAGFCMGQLPHDWFPDLLPGECRRVTLTLAPEETSDGE